MTNIFTKSFGPYACEGDTISGTYKGWEVTARIIRDDCSDTPDQRNDGFYPSLSPDAAGYIGSNDKAEFDRQMEQAKRIMQAWRDNEWFYCGIAISVAKPCRIKGRVIDQVILSDFAASLWGIECNYPGSKNEYLTEVANELLDEAVDYARDCLKALNEGENMP